MNFLWPQFLWLLAAIPLLVLLYVWLLRRKKKLALRYASLSIVREKAAARRIRLSMEGPKDLGLIEADGRKVRWHVKRYTAVRAPGQTPAAEPTAPAAETAAPAQPPEAAPAVAPPVPEGTTLSCRSWVMASRSRTKSELQGN